MDEEIGFLGHLYTADVKRGLAPLQRLDQGQFRALLQVHLPLPPLPCPPPLSALAALPGWALTCAQNVVRYVQAEEPSATELRAAFKGACRAARARAPHARPADWDAAAPLFTPLFFIVRGAVRSRAKLEQVADEVPPPPAPAPCADRVRQVKLLKLPPALEADLQKAVAAWCALRFPHPTYPCPAHARPAAPRRRRRRCSPRAHTTPH